MAAHKERDPEPSRKRAWLVFTSLGIGFVGIIGAVGFEIASSDNDSAPATPIEENVPEQQEMSGIAILGGAYDTLVERATYAALDGHVALCEDALAQLDGITNGQAPSIDCAPDSVTP